MSDFSSLSPRAQGILERGISVRAFSDSVDAIREVALLGNAMPEIPFVTTLDAHDQGMPGALIGRFVPLRRRAVSTVVPHVAIGTSTPRPARRRER